MHVPDHVMDPGTCIATTAVSITAVGYASYRVYRDFPRRKLPLLGVVAACVFAAQMFNFPISSGTSGHLLGAVLAAILLGPWAAMLALTAVLVVQCFLFQDGGVTALGANVLNIAVVGSVVGFAVYDRLRTSVAGRRGVILSAAVASWVAVVIGAAMCSVELAAGGSFTLGESLQSMLATHALIGLGEAAIVAVAIAAVQNWHPALVGSRVLRTNDPAPRTRLIFGGLALAAAIVLLAAPFTSALPDGLETTLMALGHSESPALLAAPLSQYSVPAIHSPAVQSLLAGLMGIAAVFVVSLALASPARSEASWRV